MDRRGFLSSLAATAYPLSDVATAELEELDSMDGGWRCYGFDHGNTAFVEDERGPFDGVDVGWSFDTGGAVLSSPAVVAGSVYVGSWSGGMHRLDAASGEAEWSFETGERKEVQGLESGGEFPVEGGVESSPCVHDGSVYFGAYDGFLYSVDAESGEMQWRYETPSIIRSSPVTVDDSVYLGDWTGALHAVDRETGERLWRYSTEFDHVYSTPCIYNERLYFGSVEFGFGGDGALHCVDADSGEESWRVDVDGGVASSPAAADDIVYYGSVDGGMHAVDADSGELVWEFIPDAAVTASPAVDDDRVYIADDDGAVYGFNHVSGDVDWAWRFDDRFYASHLSASPTTVYLGGHGGRLYALDSTTGGPRWSFGTDDRVRSTAVLADEQLYLGSWDGGVYALEEGSETGEEVEVTEVTKEIQSRRHRGWDKGFWSWWNQLVPER